VFPADGQITQVADRCGIVVWLMRGCGLRIEEALGVHREDFRSPRILRLTGQASRDGSKKLPLKHRKHGEYRDVAVPGRLWEMVKDLPEGPLCPGNYRLYPLYETVRQQFQGSAKHAGIPAGFRPHSLRHAFAFALLSRGVPIPMWRAGWDTRLSGRLSTRTRISCRKRRTGVAVLDAEHAEWSRTSCRSSVVLRASLGASTAQRPRARRVRDHLSQRQRR
jgi:integrase